MEQPEVTNAGNAVNSNWVGSTIASRVRAKRFDVVAVVLIFLAGFAFYLSGVEEQDYHLDESRWINRAHYLTDLADPFGPTWNHQYLTRGQPPVGSYSIGLGLILQGHDLDTNDAYDFRRTRAWNEQYGTLPSNEDLMAARRWNSLLGAAAASVLYLVVRNLTNPTGGIVAAIFYLANPLEIWYNRIALADSTLTLTLAFLFLATIHFMRKPRWWLAIAIGILIGLGGGNKFTPLALCIPLAGVGGLLWLRAWWFRRKHPQLESESFWRLPAFSDMSWMLLSTPFVALATFVLTYPYLWPDPIRRPLWMLDFRQAEMDNQYRLNPHFQTDSPLESLAMTYETLGDTWSSTLQIFQWLHLDKVGDILSSADLWLAMAGIALLTFIGFRKGLRSAELMVAALIVFQVATILLSMRVAFERYYLPIMFGEFVAIGCTVGYLTSRFSHKQKQVPVHEPGQGTA